jgi:hypothetical protein
MSSHCGSGPGHKKEPGMNIFSIPRSDDQARLVGLLAALVNQFHQPATVYNRPAFI